MKVTDGAESPTNTKASRKVPDLAIPPLKDPLEGNGHGMDASSSSSGEDVEVHEGDMNGSINGLTTPPSPNDEVVNGQNGTTSDKENSKPLKKGSSKKSKSAAAAKNSRSNRSSEERNGSKPTNGAKDEEEECEKMESESVPKDSEGKELPEDVYYVHDAGLTIKIVAPAAEPFEIQVRQLRRKLRLIICCLFCQLYVVFIILSFCNFQLQVSSSEIVQELHQLLMEREDTCHRTCFSLQLDGNTLDNFAELKSVAGLKDGSVIKVSCIRVSDFNFEFKPNYI